MKTFGWLVGILALLAGSIFIMPPAGVSAANCTNVSSFGAVRLFLPDLPSTGEYVLWVRVQSPSNTSRVLAEVNEQCLDITAPTPVATEWVWHAHQTSGTPYLLSFNSTNAGSIKLYGVQAGVKIDKVLLAPADCVPVDFGTNCHSGVEAVAAAEGVVALPPPSEESVSGNVILSPTPQRFASRLESVSYTVGGRTLQRSQKPEPFDTTMVENGKYTVLIETTLDDGERIRESTVIEVDNPANAFSPVMRWLRLNRNGVMLGLIIGGSLLVASTLFTLIRRWYIRRRELKFHGF